MTFVLDNLTAILVGTVLLGALFLLQQRGQESGIEATQRYQAQAQASTLSSTLEREVENIRSRAATQEAFKIVAGGGSVGSDAYRLRLRQAVGTDGETYTKQFSFPTLATPDALNASPTVIVTYLIEPTAEAVEVDGRLRPVYTATRYQFERGGPNRQTAVYPDIIDFDVVAYDLDDNPITEETSFGESPPRVEVTLVTAPRLTSRTSDHERTQVTTVRNARAIRVSAATAIAGTAPVDETLPGGIPDLPGDPSPAPPSPPPGPSPGPSPAPSSSPTPSPSPPPPAPEPDTCIFFLCF